jgi:hypothetical protein
MYHASIMKTLEQKEKVIEKLTKEALTLSEKQHTNNACNSSNTNGQRENELVEQIETLNVTIKELNDRVELKNKEIQDNQVGFYFKIKSFMIINIVTL